MKTKVIDTQPVYRHTVDYAMEHRELKQYKTSCSLNVDCCVAIERALAEHFQHKELDALGALDEVRAQFSDERIGYVLASTVVRMQSNLRITDDNKCWAYRFLGIVPLNNAARLRGGEVQRVHPRFINSFIDCFRENTEKDYIRDNSADSTKWIQTKASVPQR